MFCYFDTAYVAKSYLNEPGGKEVRLLCEQASERISSELTIGELSVVFHRHVREGKLSNAQAKTFRRQFEDDENLLILGAALVADLGVTYAVTPRCELYVNAENLTDERVETGRSTDGIVNTGTPRLVTGGIRCTW